jgi:hypothetical protein
MEVGTENKNKNENENQKTSVDLKPSAGQNPAKPRQYRANTAPLSWHDATNSFD